MSVPSFLHMDAIFLPFWNHFPDSPFSYEVMILSLANAVERSKILEISMTSPAYPVYASLGRENN